MYKTSKNFQDYSYKNITDLSNKNVIIRADLDVAIDDEGRMVEDVRYKAAFSLIEELAGNVKSLIITGHLGRPTEKEKKFSFWHVVETLNADLKAKNPQLNVELIESLDEATKQRIRNNEDKNTIFYLENIRFFKGEESKDKNERMNFAKELAIISDVFINNAFASYREAASTYDIATLLPSYIGPVFLKEVEALSKFSSPERPFVSVLGGAKLSEKLDALNALAEISDHVIIGGAMAYTLMKSQGISVGNSLVEEDKLDVAKEIMQKYSSKLILPADHLVAEKFDKDAKYEYTEDSVIPEGKVAIDIGWKSINAAKEVLKNAKSILWNGPMGVFEWDHSAVGTEEIGKAISTDVETFDQTSDSSSKKFVLAGGGDSIAAINKLKLEGFDHISTGGGAMLAFIAYDKFPILDVIVDRR